MRNHTSVHTGRARCIVGALMRVRFGRLALYAARFATASVFVPYIFGYEGIAPGFALASILLAALVLRSRTVGPGIRALRLCGLMGAAAALLSVGSDHTGQLGVVFAGYIGTCGVEVLSLLPVAIFEFVPSWLYISGVSIGAAAAAIWPTFAAGLPVPAKMIPVTGLVMLCAFLQTYDSNTAQLARMKAKLPVQ